MSGELEALELGELGESLVFDPLSSLLELSESDVLVGEAELEEEEEEEDEEEDLVAKPIRSSS